MICGLDIGGTKTELAVFDDALTPVSSVRLPTVKDSYPGFLDMVCALVTDAEQKYGAKCIVGVGMPGLTDSEGLALTANVPAANHKNVREDLSVQLDRSVVMENDCRCFALSEAHGGAGNSYPSVYGAILGTGAAGGFIVDGKLIPARQGIAGEYGHCPLPAYLQKKYDLPVVNCGCGLKGCLETYISGPGLASLFQLFSGQKASVPDILKRAQNGNDQAVRTTDCHLDLLGHAIASLVKAYDPHVIVMGGGLSRAEGLVEKISDAASAHLFDRFKVPPIKKAKFGDASGARGAAILARQTYRA